MDLKKSKISPKLCVKQQLLYTNLKKFYRNEERINLLIDILNGQSKLSLRIIDWFVTKYSKIMSLHLIIHWCLKKKRPDIVLQN